MTLTSYILYLTSCILHLYKSFKHTNPNTPNTLHIQVLEEIWFEGMPIGIHTIEALCSHVPNVHSIGIVGSKYITDADIRCLTGESKSKFEIEIYV